MAQRAEDGGKSECRLVMGWTGVAPSGNITPRESGLTSAWSLVTRTSGKQSSEVRADDSDIIAGAHFTIRWLPHISIVKV